MATEQPIKIQKNVELVNLITSFVDSEMDTGDKIFITPLSQNINLPNGRHPHVDTVRTKLMEAEVWTSLPAKVKFGYKKGKLSEIEKIEPDNAGIEFKKEIRQGIASILSRMDIMDVNLERLTKKVKELGNGL